MSNLKVKTMKDINAQTNTLVTVVMAVTAYTFGFDRGRFVCAFIYNYHVG